MLLFRQIILAFTIMCSLQSSADVIEHSTCNLYLLTDGKTSYAMKIKEWLTVKNYNVFQISIDDFRKRANIDDLYGEVDVERGIIIKKRNLRRLHLKSKEKIKTSISFQICKVVNNSDRDDLDVTDVSKKSEAFQTSKIGANLEAWELVINDLPECMIVK